MTIAPSEDWKYSSTPPNRGTSLNVWASNVLQSHSTRQDTFAILQFSWDPEIHRSTDPEIQSWKFWHCSLATLEIRRNRNRSRWDTTSWLQDANSAALIQQLPDASNLRSHAIGKRFALDSGPLLIANWHQRMTVYSAANAHTFPIWLMLKHTNTHSPKHTQSCPHKHTHSLFPTQAPAVTFSNTHTQTSKFKHKHTLSL